MRTESVYSVTEDGLREAVLRIVSVGTPEKVILFGSRAHGNEKPDSDVDLLIIDAEARNQELWDRYHDAVSEVLDAPVDVALRTPEEVASWRNVSNHFLTKVLRDGRVLYQREVDLLKEEPPPRDHRDHARFWLRIADRDFADARTLLGAGGSAQAVCFYAQQAIEKYLKAILAYDGADIPRTHSLQELRRKVAYSRRRLKIDRRVDELTKFAANGRYGEDPAADDELAKMAVALAESVGELVKQQLLE